MATLEKIRSHSVLLLVIIGLALLAFVIGDFFNSGSMFFGTGTTVAKVDGHKIDVQDFQNRLEQANQQVQQSGQKVDGAVLQQQVLAQMVQETLMNDELERLGITVTDEELKNALTGPASQYVDMFVQQRYGFESAAQLNDIANNPAKYNLDAQTANQFRALWKSLEDEMEKSLKQQKFANLFNGAITANDLDAKALYEENASTSRVAFAKKDYATLSDDDFKPTDAEIQAQWNKRKETFKLTEEQRAINYIAVAIAPSDADIQAAEVKINDAYNALRTQPATDGLAEMPDFIVNRNSVALNAITDNRLKQFVDSASAGSVAQISHVGNDYTMAKLISREVKVDSVCFDFGIVTGDKAQVDSILANLNSGSAKLADVAAEGQMQDSTWIQLSNPQAAEIREQMLAAETGRWFTPDTAAAMQGARVMRVRSRKQPVSIVDVAVVTFTAEPSGATVNKLESDLRSFLAENNTAALFNENAAKAGYTSVPTYVTASTPQIGRIDDTRSAVRWAMEAKKGQVSPVFGDLQTGQLVAVALDDIYKDYIPASDSQVRQNLTTLALTDKKAEKLIGDYKGKAKDIAGYAQLMGSQVDTTSVTFGQAMISRLGYNESEILGATAGAKAGQLVGPVQGNNAVVVLQVLDVNNEGRPFSLAESMAQYNRSRGAAAMSNMLPAILQGNGKVTNNLMKFFRD